MAEQHPRTAASRPFRTAILGACLIATNVTAALGQANRSGPRIGYVYPAGGQRGTTVEVLVGGQALMGAGDVHITGSGVRGKVIQHYRPLRNIDKAQRDELQRRLRELIQDRVADAPRADRLGPGAWRGSGRFTPDGTRPNASRPSASRPAEAPPPLEHPLLRNLENKTLPELLHTRHELLNLAKRRQPNVQIADSVLIELTIDRDAPAGDREIRLRTPQGLTNPMCFQVGPLPEVSELEPNDPAGAAPPEPRPVPVKLPATLNGQIKPGDVDRFRFSARKGQVLLIDAQARHLIPYLADAVPGWFQATVTLRDADGREVAFADDHRFDPDPTLLFKVAQDGEYDLEIRDALYRGREDFVYRVAVGEQAQIARSTNRAAATAPASASDGADALAMSDTGEAEPNDALQSAQAVAWPCLVAGRINKPGDVDVFQIKGRAGERIVAEVRARRDGSPLDSLLRVTDAAGRVLEWNDDREDKESGLLTHHADAYLTTRLPADGIYYVTLSDTQHQGGPAYGYRLRLSPPQPDFALRLTPSSINVRPGGSAAIQIHVVRKDGYDGEIQVSLKDAPPGLRLSNGRIAPGAERAELTLTGPRAPLARPIELHLEATAVVDGKTLQRPVVPAEDLMQAFIYRHLTPSQQLLVATIGGGRGAMRPIERRANPQSRPRPPQLKTSTAPRP